MKQPSLTRTHGFVNALVAIVLTAAVYSALVLLGRLLPELPPLMAAIRSVFLDRGTIPYLLTFGFFWGLGMLMMRPLEIARDSTDLEQKKARLRTLQDANVSLEVIAGEYGKGSRLADAYFGEVVAQFPQRGDRTEVHQSIAQCGEGIRDSLESSLIPARYLIWLIPTLGFTGTVVGISQAITGFSSLVVESEGFDDIKSQLGMICLQLGVAFDTTLLALIFSAILAAAAAYVDRQESHLLGKLEGVAFGYLGPLLTSNAPRLVATTSVGTGGTASIPTGASGANATGGVIVLKTTANDEVELRDAVKIMLTDALMDVSANAQAIGEAAAAEKLTCYMEANVLLSKQLCDWITSQSVTAEGLQHLTDELKTHLDSNERLLRAQIGMNSKIQQSLAQNEAVLSKLSQEGVRSHVHISATPGA